MQALRLLHYASQLALQMQERRQNGGHRLHMNRPETPRRGELPPDGRLRLAQDAALDESVAKRPRSSQPSFPGGLNGILNQLDFVLAHHGEVSETLLDR